MQEKIDSLEENLELTKKQNDHIIMEMSFMKLFIANKMGWTIDEMNYGQ
jgi:hypothetical protein